jgi:membrane-bound serine protease (ClpP class)
MTLIAVQATGGWEIATNPVVMAILLTIGLAGIFIELLAPGQILPGAVGIIAFVLYFYGHMEATEIGISVPVIFIIGLVLLIVEVVVPGGIFGTLGTIALFYSVIAAAESVTAGITALAIGILVTILLLWVLYRFFGFRSKWSKIILVDKQDNADGYTSSKDRKYLIGKTGVALSPLRPSGWAKIDGNKEDVVSDGELIEQGSTIMVINVEGTRVVVKKVDEVEQ